MIWFLIILLVLALIVCLIIVPFFTVEIRFKENVLHVKLSNWFFKKNLDIDFNPKDTLEPEPEPKAKEKPKPETKDKEDKKSNIITDKINGYKNRIYSKENGFSIHELRAVKHELSQLISKILSIIKDFFGSVRYKIQIPSVYFNLEYGTGDPASTGMMYGSIWGIVGLLHPIMTRYFIVNYPSLSVVPDFTAKRFSLEFKSIIKVRPVHIINASVVMCVKLLFNILKFIYKKDV